jgi:hypothetical protein
MRETLACLEVAEALGYLRDVDPNIRDRIERVIGTLVKIVAPRAA